MKVPILNYLVTSVAAIRAAQHEDTGIPVAAALSPRATDSSCSVKYGSWYQNCAGYTVQMCYNPSFGEICCGGGVICYKGETCPLSQKTFGDPATFGEKCCAAGMSTSQCVALNAGNGGLRTTSAAGAGSTGVVAESHGISMIARKGSMYLDVGGGVILCLLVGLLL